MEDYEKKYKNALEWARQVMNGKIGFVRDEVQEIFSELAESEDERIKKEIVRFIRMEVEDEIVGNKWVAWLEKQHTEPNNGVCFYCYGHRWDMCARDNGIEIVMDGIPVRHFSYKDCEQTFGGKSALEAIKEEKVDNQNCVELADMAEPKFKVGDWIVNNEDGSVGQITNLIVDESGYGYNHTNGWFHSVFEKDYHPWTIEDAKDGDVLAYENDIVIFKKNNYNPKDQRGCMFVHCAFYYKRGYWYEIGCINPTYYKPANEEQRDLLFSKMKEAGFEWDAEKKELKKIE